MEKLGLRTDKIYIVGVSGGPDSMALFDMCRRQHIQVVAAHMNYQLRESAKRDMDIVKSYCEQYGISCEIKLQEKPCIGNFQAFARTQRYEFYREVVQKYNAHAVLLAHQMDDHMETYIMQKQSKRQATYFGIQAEATLFSCTILRPLLPYTKEELETYCIENGVPYGIDESNLGNHYARNRIRHTIIEKMSYQKKMDYVLQIEEENTAWRMLCEKADAFLATWNTDICKLRNIKEEVREQVLIQFIYRQCHIHLQKNELRILCDFIMKQSKQWTRDISSSYVIYNEYGKLCVDTKKDVSYMFEYQECMFVETPYFKISKQGVSTEALSLQPSDYPLTIRSYQVGDEIQLQFGRKKVNRWFIDRKIPKKERRRWPIVVNAFGNVILVPKLGCDIAHFSNNPTCFVVK